MARVKALTSLLRILRDGVAKHEIPGQMTDPLVYAWVNASIRPADYISIAGRSGPSATRDLALAAAAGYLTASGETKARRYLLGPTLQGVQPIPISAR
jgi:hypothetical protein